MVQTAYQDTTQEATDAREIRESSRILELRLSRHPWSFQANFSLEDILSAAVWGGTTYFIKFYLRNVAWLQQDLMTIGTVIAGSPLPC